MLNGGDWFGEAVKKRHGDIDIGSVWRGRLGPASCYEYRHGAFRLGSHGGVRSGIVVNGEVRQLWTG